MSYDMEPITPRFSAHPAVDTFVDWALGPGARYFFANTDGSLERSILTITVEVRGITPEEFASGEGLLEPTFLARWSAAVSVPPYYLGLEVPGENPKRSTFFAAQVTPDFFLVLGESRSARVRDDITRITLGAVMPPSAIGERKGKGPKRKPPKYPEPKPAFVVTGIIDDDLAFLHERFRTRNHRSRVEYAWLQGYPHGPGPYHRPEPEMNFGIELRKHDDAATGVKGIDSLLEDARRGGQIDEDVAYDLAGLVDFSAEWRTGLALRASHGTHVMDVACGYAPNERKVEPDQPTLEELDDNPIVCVQLGAEVAADTSGASLAPVLEMAIDYILARADDIATERGLGALPVVVNFSYGTYGGPHDGTSELEVMMDQVIADRDALLACRTAIVLPAGNSHLARTHARVAFATADSTATLPWRIAPDNRAPSSVEIWLPRREADDGAGTRMRVRLTLPGVPAQILVGESDGLMIPLIIDGVELASVAYDRIGGETDRGRFSVRAAATADNDSGVPLAPSGTWQIELLNVSLAPDAIVHAWVQRGDSRPGFGLRGRQSHFDLACYERFDHAGRHQEADQPGCLLQRASAFSGIATGDRTVVVGGHLGHGRVDGRDRPMARYASSGPLLGAQRPDGPDASAVSEDGVGHPGVLGAGARSGSTLAMGGTSVAAPRVARRIAEAFANDEPVNRMTVRAWAEADDPSGVANPHEPVPERAGGGRLQSRPMRRVARY